MLDGVLFFPVTPFTESGDVDLAKVATTQFVNKGVGVDLRKKLTGK